MDLYVNSSSPYVLPRDTYCTLGILNILNAFAESIYINRVFQDVAPTTRNPANRKTDGLDPAGYTAIEFFRNLTLNNIYCIQ